MEHYVIIMICILLSWIRITHNGKLVASGSFDVETGEMGRNIYIYTPV